MNPNARGGFGLRTVSRMIVATSMALFLTGCNLQPNASATNSPLPQLPNLVSQTPSPNPSPSANNNGKVTNNPVSNILTGSALDAFRKQEQQGYAAGQNGNYNAFYDEHDAAMDAIGQIAAKPKNDGAAVSGDQMSDAAALQAANQEYINSLKGKPVEEDCLSCG